MKRLSTFWLFVILLIFFSISAGFIACNGYIGAFLSTNNLEIESEVGVETVDTVYIFGNNVIIFRIRTIEESDWIEIPGQESGLPQSQVNISCTPEALDTETARYGFQVSGSGGQSKQELELTVECTGIAGDLAFDPASIDFGDVDFSTQPVTKSSNLNNDSEDDCVIPDTDPITISGDDAADFTAAFNPPDPDSVEAGGSATVDVTLKAADCAEGKTATITVNCEDARTAILTVNANVQNCP